MVQGAPHIEFGIIGCRHGHVHGLIKELLDIPGATCAGVFDSDAESLRSVTDRFPVPAASSAEALLNDPGVLLIGTAEVNSDKAPLLIQALEAGKHVIADKPLCTTLPELNEIERIATEKHLRVGLALTERFGDANRRMKQVVADGLIGHVANVMCWRPHRLGRQGRPDWMFDDERYGGILVDLAIHDADIIRWVSGGDFLEVTAYQNNIGNSTDTDFGDIGVMLARLSTGATGFVRTDWFTPKTSPVHGDTRFLVTGTTGMIEVRTAGDLWSSDEATRPRVLIMSDDRAPQQLDGLPAEKDLVRDFVDSIVHGIPSEISNSDTFEATRATLMARLSCQLGRTVTRGETL
jgi:predicted dehydrogenase